ncbi:MAG: type II toxin-antitoxin system VapC family toxin [Methanophagales archaeon]|nr:type II toxin-antitoxin system VapC family toxin [Methanophagales archaeon]
MSTTLGGKYRLLFKDALHLSAMKRLNVKNIASRDSDFERVNDIMIWIP